MIKIITYIVKCGIYDTYDNYSFRYRLVIMNNFFKQFYSLIVKLFNLNPDNQTLVKLRLY